MSTITLTELKAKSAKLIKATDKKLAAASTNIMKISWNIYKTECKHEYLDTGIQTLGPRQHDLKAAILFPDFYAAAKRTRELAGQVSIYKYRLNEEKTEKERFKTRFAEASLATTRLKREKKELTKVMDALRLEMRLEMDDMRQDLEAENGGLQRDLDAARARHTQDLLDLEEDRKASLSSLERREANLERFHEESLTAKDETIKMLETAKNETIEMLEDEIRFLKSAKCATATEAAFDKLEMASSAGLWSN
jgi:hypothetical protein